MIRINTNLYMSKKFYIQITAGRGPIECAAAVGKITELVKNDLYHMVDMDNSVKYNIIDFNEHYDSDSFNRYDCFMSVTIEVCYTDSSVLDKMKNQWEGTVKWVATKNTFRPNHKRKNWFVGISFYEIPESIKINESDIRYETMRSSGAGGQNVNKVESAVRAIYIPTGDYVVAQDSRDQPMNKKLARQRLIDKLTLIDKYKMDVLKSDNWLEHSSLERGGQVKTFKGEL